MGNVFRRAATLADLDPDTQWLSGHSARVGAAQDMVRSGATTVQVQSAGRWGSERMPVRYAERVIAHRRHARKASQRLILRRTPHHGDEPWPRR